MLVTQKAQYALRAIFELARRAGQPPAKLAEIAEAQAIPPRFLEVILSQLRQSGIVESRRGREGGYILGLSPQRLTVGKIMQLMQGPVKSVSCVVGSTEEKCPLYGGCVFLPMWEQAREALCDVYDHTTFQDLIDQEQRMKEDFVPGYTI